MRFLAIVVVVLGALGAGCASVAEPVARGATIPTDSAAVCTSHCAAMGLRMSAVVVILNSVGCVCQPEVAASHPGPPGSAATGASTVPGSSAAVGGAVVAAHIAAAQQQARNNAAAASAK